MLSEVEAFLKQVEILLLQLPSASLRETYSLFYTFRIFLNIASLYN
jgi:hypothetical protein